LCVAWCRTVRGGGVRIVFDQVGLSRWGEVALPQIADCKRPFDLRSILPWVSCLLLGCWLLGIGSEEKLFQLKKWLKNNNVLLKNIRLARLFQLSPVISLEGITAGCGSY
jgi:hypothetical protein